MKKIILITTLELLQQQRPIKYVLEQGTYDDIKLSTIPQMSSISSIKSTRKLSFDDIQKIDTKKQNMLRSKHYKK